MFNLEFNGAIATNRLLYTMRSFCLNCSISAHMVSKTNIMITILSSHGSLNPIWVQYILSDLNVCERGNKQNHITHKISEKN